MPAKISKRNQLLELASSSVLKKGFAGTSIDELVFEAGISKNGFFYHFKDKNALANALLQKYLEEEETILNECFDLGTEQSENSLDAFVRGLEILAEKMSELEQGHPGCLVATLTYSDQLFNKAVQENNKMAFVNWRAYFKEKLQDIQKDYSLQHNVNLDILADSISCTLEGSILISRALKEPKVIRDQILLLTHNIKNHFQTSE